VREPAGRAPAEPPDGHADGSSCCTPSRRDNRVDIVRDDGATSSLWWATKNEWLGLIDVAELGLEALYGGFGHEPYTLDSREYVFIARRRVSER
jgi:hypothetical protein